MSGENQSIKTLKTGQYVVIKHVLPEIKTIELRKIANKLNSTESRPIYIAAEPLLGKCTSDRYKSAGINIILKRSSAWLKAILGEKWLILANKSLLRRTWPSNAIRRFEM